MDRQPRRRLSTKQAADYEVSGVSAAHGACLRHEEKVHEGGGRLDALDGQPRGGSAGQRHRGEFFGRAGDRDWRSRCNRRLFGGRHFRSLAAYGEPDAETAGSLAAAGPTAEEEETGREVTSQEPGEWTQPQEVKKDKRDQLHVSVSVSASTYSPSFISPPLFFHQFPTVVAPLQLRGCHSAGGTDGVGLVCAFVYSGVLGGAMMHLRTIALSRSLALALPRRGAGADLTSRSLWPRGVLSAVRSCRRCRLFPPLLWCAFRVSRAAELGRRFVFDVTGRTEILSIC